MSKVKRGAEDVYDGVLSIQDIKNLDVKSLVANDSVLALWCPSSMISEGIDVMNSWGFEFKQTHVWVKIKNDPFLFIKKIVRRLFRQIVKGKISFSDARDYLDTALWARDNQVAELSSDPEPQGPDKTLAFGMGRLFRQTHEIVLIGVRGKIYKHLKNKSQRSVHFYPVTKHSEKPELLQDMLEKMFPEGVRLELFARRNRPGWVCIGNQSVISPNEDIRFSLRKLQKIRKISSPGTDNAIYICNDHALYKVWKDISV